MASHPGNNPEPAKCQLRRRNTAEAHKNRRQRRSARKSENQLPSTHYWSNRIKRESDDDFSASSSNSTRTSLTEPGAIAVPGLEGMGASVAQERVNDNSNSEVVVLEATLVSEDIDLRERQLRLREEELQQKLLQLGQVISAEPLPLADTRQQQVIHGALSTDTLPVDKQALLSRADVVGREAEIGTLKSIWKNVVSKKYIDAPIDYISISGQSGIGKTTLAMSLQLPTKQVGGIFILGKFPQDHQNQPFVWLVSLCDSICDELHKDHLPKLRSALLEKLGEDVCKRLSCVLPRLNEIFRLNGTGMESSPLELHYDENMRNWFSITFRTFLLTLGTVYEEPLVIMFDDLQWSDQFSLSLIEDLAASKYSKTSLLVIGCFRSEEVGKDDDLSIMLQRMKARQSTAVTEITVSPLTKANVALVLSSMLLREEEADEGLVDLASICHQRTLGNPFFLVEFVHMLCQESLISTDARTGRLIWDCTKIEQDAMVASNVVVLLRKEVESIAPKHNQLLQIAALLGSHIDYHHLQVLHQALVFQEQEQDVGDELRLLEEAMQFATQQGFIMTSSKTNKYRWAHDKVREAILSTLGNEEAVLFRQSIGETLIRQMGLEQIMADDNIVNIVNLFDYTGPNFLSQGYATELIQLNIIAGQKAIELGVFQTARTCFRNGISIFSPSSWSTDRDAAFTLHILSLEMETYFGDLARVVNLAELILLQPSITACEKYRVYIAWAAAIAGKDRYQEAAEMCIRVLSEAGWRFPKSRAGLFIETIKSVIVFKSRSKAFLSERRILEDAEINQASILMDRLFEYSYLADNGMMPVILKQELECTRRHGLSRCSPPAYACVAVVMSGILGDFAMGTAYAKRALAMLDELKSEESKSRTMFYSYAMILSWTQPLHDILDKLTEAHDIGLRSGDSDSALFCQCNRVCVSCFSGHSLSEIDEDIRAHDRELKDFGNIKTRQFSNLTWQVILNLMGRSKNPALLIGGQVFTKELYEGGAGENRAMQAMVKGHEVILWTYLGNYEMAAQAAIENQDDTMKAFPGTPVVMTEVFLGGIACAEAFRMTKKRKFLSFAKNRLSLIRSWVRAGNPNVRHHELLLKAELDCISRRRTQHAITNFELAIGIASHMKFSNDIALAHELFACFLSRKNDAIRAQSHIEQAMQNYSHWGAGQKVTQLSNWNGTRVH